MMLHLQLGWFLTAGPTSTFRHVPCPDQPEAKKELLVKTVSLLVASTGAYWRIESISPVSATTVVISLSWASLFMRGPCLPVDDRRAPETTPLEDR